ncbi:MAG: GGDEF domain-containing protein [Candidatus Wallbacteria bacterium]|nr:GGDEF domain-containing protein [Candidatus Wallbacteria bacterium]
MGEYWKPLVLGLLAGAAVFALPLVNPGGDQATGLAVAGVTVLVVAGMGVGFLSASGRESEMVVETVNKDMERLKKEVKGREKTIDEYKTKLVESTSLRRALSSIARLTVQSLEVSRVLEQVMNALVSAPIRAKRCALWLVSDQGIRLEAAMGYPGDPRRENPRASEVVSQVARTGNLIDSENAGRDPSLAAISRGRSHAFVCAPLVHNREILGVIDIEEFAEGRKEKESLRDDVDALEFVASLTAMVIKNGRMFEEAKERANTDGLTRLFTHRYFQDTLDTELKRAGRYEDPISLMITDIDHFKKFNDTYGHQIGDLVLRETAGVFKELRRENDVVARYGGEEFAVVMPHTPKDAAQQVAEQLRKAVAERTYQSEKGDLKVTISIGVSTFPDDAREKNVLIKRADAALYRAKEGGRNRVCAASAETAAKTAGGH